MAINPITIEMALSEFIILEKFLITHKNEIKNLYDEMLKLLQIMTILKLKKNNIKIVSNFRSI